MMTCVASALPKTPEISDPVTQPQHQIPVSSSELLISVSSSQLSSGKLIKDFDLRELITNDQVNIELIYLKL